MFETEQKVTIKELVNPALHLAKPYAPEDFDDNWKSDKLSQLKHAIGTDIGLGIIYRDINTHKPATDPNDIYLLDWPEIVGLTRFLARLAVYETMADLQQCGDQNVLLLANEILTARDLFYDKNILVPCFSEEQLSKNVKDFIWSQQPSYYERVYV